VGKGNNTSSRRGASWCIQPATTGTKMPAGSPVLANRKHIMREAIEIELHPESMNREEAFSLIKA